MRLRQNESAMDLGLVASALLAHQLRPSDRRDRPQTYQPTAAGAPSGMAEGTTRITGPTWRKIGGLVAAGLVVGALASSGHHSSPHTTLGPSTYPTPVDVTGDNAAQDPAADYEHDQQASQALQDAAQQRYNALQNTANSMNP
jgi:hypothetical protein